MTVVWPAGGREQLPFSNFSLCSETNKFYVCYYVFVCIPPGKAVPEMTYTVSGRTLNSTHSLNFMSAACILNVIFPQKCICSGGLHFRSFQLIDPVVGEEGAGILHSCCWPLYLITFVLHLFQFASKFSFWLCQCWHVVSVTLSGGCVSRLVLAA